MLNEKLSFLNDVLAPKKDKYLNAIFLKSNFEDNLWLIKLDEKSLYTINFDIILSNNSRLIDAANKKILKTLKYWILEIIYDGNSYLTTKSTISRKISSVLTIFDCLNLLDTSKTFPNTGFEGISIDQFKYILDKLSEDSDKFENIYRVSDRLYFYYEKLNKKSICEINNNLYSLNNQELNNFIKQLKISQLKIKDLFPDTLLNPDKWPDLLKEASSTRKNLSEYPGYFREKTNNPLSNASLIYYKKAIDILINLNHQFKKDITFSLTNLDNTIELENHKSLTKVNGRFETYPSKTIFHCFRKAIEFHISYGNDIVESYINFINNMNNAKIDTSSFDYTDEVKNIFKQSLTDKLSKLGVIELKAVSNTGAKFETLRKNFIFLDLLKVYYGAVQFVVGALMARRQSELAGLIANECIDKTHKVLLFKKSKSAKGLFGTKDTLALPIDPIAIEMITNIEKIHTIVGSKNKLFAMPNIHNPTKIKEDTSGNYYGQNLDIFMDYIEAPIINGKRLYIRQHQLRRFFAMAFFWGNGFGSMDTLRWFMGHTDVHHLYHYITESTPGEVLRSVKAQYVAEDIGKYHDLAQLIKEKYNTENFDIIETDELSEYIETLIEDGSVQIEPEFFEDDNKNRFEIIVKLLKKDK